ncbi:MAG: polyphosphate kinase 2 family protein [Bdellovibrionaceae bacterium]|nr:polyphosphate kinase 2 family protein [Pseudobdellovibrionaceae bacterium]
MAQLRLSQYDPTLHPGCKNKSDGIELTNILKKKLYDLLYLMFADGQYSLLIILQGIDTSGKDGSVRHIFSSANPQGIKVFSFKKPTEKEFRHDFLWRCHVHTPESGFTTIFNRSYYEEVTTSMIHPELLEEQHIPPEIRERSDFFEIRYNRINDFEKLLVEKGTVVVKFFLHISKKEQKKRIEERLKDRSKNWKFSKEDIKERKHWDEYMTSFEKMIQATSTRHAPWTIVASDNKWYRNYVISKTLVQELEKLKMSFPKAK